MSFEEGSCIADWLISHVSDFDAVFAFTDTLAIGLMNRLREYGMKVPDDVAIRQLLREQHFQKLYFHL
ncbi:hypothetical protein EVA_18813 [gut metagenome]|uniref:Transcriptional regulator LacI/GalR-like sensor domain-containing protein n=1 Tax=gut metagenome TaxID=749906 RepID=J9FDW1_9ZZZZ